MSEFSKSDLNKVKRGPNRASYDKKTVFEILDSHFLCHAAYLFEGTAISIPTAYGRKDETLYLHGAFKNRMLDSFLATEKVSLTITHMDGIVLARSVFHHSFNYRSAVVFGKARLVENEREKMEGLQVITENIIPGRWQEARSPNENEMKATKVIAVDITEASAKIRTGPPKDDEADYELDIWAGVIPLSIDHNAPIADDLLKDNIPLAPSAVNYRFDS